MKNNNENNTRNRRGKTQGFQEVITDIVPPIILQGTKEINKTIKGLLGTQKESRKPT
jgi:hypothetical protein